jgi:hypothetical protein
MCHIKHVSHITNTGVVQNIHIMCDNFQEVVPYILESNLHLVFAAFLNEKNLVHRLYHFSKIQL